MSGHSKWSTIKRKKGAADAKRSKIFSKLVKEITIAAKTGSSDPETNPALRLAIANAKGQSMPKSNIEKAISKGKDKDSASFVEYTFEGYLSHGIAVYVDCQSDNQQRTVANIRAIFNKYDGNLGTNGSLSFLFDQKGIFSIPKTSVEMEQDDFEMEMIDGGAEDFEVDEEYFTITTAREDFGTMQSKLEELNIEAESAGLERIPHETLSLDLETGQKIMKAIDVFEDDDDVKSVFHNLEITDELMESMD